MKLLAFSDVHSDLNACRRLVEVARQSAVDVVVGAGDFATMRKNLQPVIDVLAQCDRPLILVPGNGESLAELQVAVQAYPNLYVLHGSGTQVAQQSFFGLGYAVPDTPFGAWSCDLSEESASDLLADCPSNAILVTHSPPYGHVDRNSRGDHVGSRSVLAAIHRTRPSLVLCGHVHDCWKQTSHIDDTTIHNLGPQGKEIVV